MKTINDLMSDWQQIADAEYVSSVECGIPVDTTDSDQILDEMKAIIGGQFNLGDADFYHGLLLMIETARQLKRFRAEVMYWYEELERVAPEDYDIIEAEHRFNDYYNERDNP